MLLEDLFNDLNVRYIAEKLLENCSQYLKSINYKIDDYGIYRGINKNIGFEHLKYDLHRERTPSDMNFNIHNILNKVFNKKFGYEYRNAMFVTGDYSTAKLYGNVIVIFPFDDYEFVWSNEIKDLFSYLKKEFDYNQLASMPEEELENFIEENIIDKYKNYDILNAIKSKNEIMLKTSDYYAISAHKFFDNFISKEIEAYIMKLIRDN